MWTSGIVDSMKSLLATGRYKYTRLSGPQAIPNRRDAGRAAWLDHRRALKMSLIAMSFAIVLYLAVAYG